MTTSPRFLSLPEQISALEELRQILSQEQDLIGRIAFLDKLPHVAQFLTSYSSLNKLLKPCSIAVHYVVKILIAIRQGPIVFHGLEFLDAPKDKFNHLVQKLLELEKFYDAIGGILGYQLTILKLIVGRNNKRLEHATSYRKPEGMDISGNTVEVRRTVRWGIEALLHMGEIYPMGGAGDRLDLQDELSGELLPAALLDFCGRTLVEGLIRDLQAREYLYYKLFGKQLMTPLAIMTSWEKNNHQRLIDLCESNEWYGRSRESFRFFLQPLVPMVTEDGEWVMSGVLQPFLKPGGHGAIWKVAADAEVFAWLEGHHRKKVLVRQINNPVANTDNGLLAMTGIGFQKDKKFGFASCRRLINTPEGMNVLKEVKVDAGYEYCITNVEYTEFKQCGIEDVPESTDSAYSLFPSNTNILFADLDAIQRALKICSLPGLLINMKSHVKYHELSGDTEKLAGRLESTMQNIADYIVNVSTHKLGPGEAADLNTFLTYNDRRKTISVVKQTYVPGKPLNGTPEGCFYDMLENYRDLLVHHCNMELPPKQDAHTYLAHGPNFIALFHPALGILYSVIAQKIRRGRISKGSELIIEAAEVDIANLDLEGSLVIDADTVMGKKDIRGVIVYDSAFCGKCSLINVRVRNQGYVYTNGIDAWRLKHVRKEALHIILHGNAEFYAEDVELTGDLLFDVPDGHRLVVYHQGDEVAWHCEKIAKATWRWDYVFDNEDHICLEKIKNTR